MITLIRDNVEIIVDTEEKAKTKESEGFSRLYRPTVKRAVKAPETGKKSFSDMTKSELIAYAYESGIDIDPRSRKADIIAALK